MASRRVEGSGPRTEPHQGTAAIRRTVPRHEWTQNSSEWGKNLDSRDVRSELEASLHSTLDCFFALLI